MLIYSEFWKEQKLELLNLEEDCVNAFMEDADIPCEREINLENPFERWVIWEAAKKFTDQGYTVTWAEAVTWMESDDLIFRVEREPLI